MSTISLAGQPLGQLLGIADGGRGAEELRVRAVEAAQPLQPPEDVGHVRAVDAAVAVQLVHDHVAQVLEQLHPLRVVRQDPLVQHVGVRDHDVGPRADGLARVLRRVAVVGEGADVGAERLDHRVELGELVLGQRLGGEEVEGPRVGVLQDAVEDGQVVAEGLARGRGRHHDRALPRRRHVVGRPLVGVEPLVAPAAEHVAELPVKLGREVGELRRPGRVVAEGGEHRLDAQRLLDLEALQDPEKGFPFLTPPDELLAQEPSPWPHPLGGLTRRTHHAGGQGQVRSEASILGLATFGRFGEPHETRDPRRRARPGLRPRSRGRNAAL